MLTILITAIVVFLAALVMLRLFSRKSTVTSSVPATACRRSGLDRRKRYAPVRRERRKRSRREEDAVLESLTTLGPTRTSYKGDSR